MIAAFAALVAVAASPAGPEPLTVEGTATCPTPAEVEVRLRPLLADGPAGPARRVRVDREGARLRVSLRLANGTEAGVREFEETRDCEGLAEAAAVVLATWMARPDEEGALERRPPPPPPPVPSIPVVRARPQAPQNRPSSVGGARAGRELALGLGGVLAAGELAPAVQLSGVLGLTGRWGMRLEAVATGWQQAGLPDGLVDWRRHQIVAGPQAVVVRQGASALALHTGAALGILQAQGRGFDENRGDTTLAAGLTISLRATQGRGLWRGFTQVGASYWPGRTTFYQQPGGGTTMPRWSWLATLGAALGS